MNKKIFLSIITPFYKSEEKLIKLLSSTKVFKFDYEVIIVNDSPEVDISDFASEKVKIINNDKNRWVKYSRWNGYKNINKRSTHIAFIDGDDVFAKDDWFSEIKSNPNKIIQFSYNKIYTNKITKNDYSLEDRRGYIQPYIWTKVYPIKLIEKNELFMNFLSNVNTHDDGLEMRHSLQKNLDNGDFIYSGKSIIHYYMYKNGSSRSLRPSVVISEVNTFLVLIDLIPMRKKELLKKAADTLETKKTSIAKKEYLMLKKKVELLGGKITLKNKLIGIMFRNFAPYFWEDLYQRIRYGYKKFKK